MASNTLKTDSRIISQAEKGFERQTKADTARFNDIAKGSCGEVRSMYYIAEDLKYVAPETALERRNRALKISRGTSSFTKALRAKPTT